MKVVRRLGVPGGRRATWSSTAVLALAVSSMVIAQSVSGALVASPRRGNIEASGGVRQDEPDRSRRQTHLISSCVSRIYLMWRAAETWNLQPPQKEQAPRPGQRSAQATRTAQQHFSCDRVRATAQLIFTSLLFYSHLLTKPVYLLF